MPRLAEDVALIEPLFWVPKPGGSIELARDVISLEAGDFKAEGEGIARLATAPDNQVVITAMLRTDTMAWLRWGDDRRDFLLRFGPTGRPAKVFCTRSSTTDAGNVSLDLILQTGAVSRFRDARIRLVSVLVHVMNFPHFFGRSDFQHIDGNGGRTRLGRILMTDSVWSVELQEHLGTRKIVDKLKSEGGNAITHVARINRTDGKSFSIKQAEALIYKLHQFLSFARGHWTPLFGATGFNARGEKVFEQWGNQFSTPWMPRSGWFDVHHAECLEDLFQDFMRVRDSHANGPALSKALYWFVRSNGGGSRVGTDGALILSQAALEGLAVTSLAAAGLPSAGTAADRIRRMCSNLKVPIRIPAELRYLSSGRRKKQWVDGPEALAKIRNDLVHAKRRTTFPIGPAVPETWCLAQWYLELTMLALCGYTGVYSNRLAARWVGEVESVPWVPKPKGQRRNGRLP